MAEAAVIETKSAATTEILIRVPAQDVGADAGAIASRVQ